MNRRRALDDISRGLDGRRLVWFGTRGEDVEAIADLPELSASFSIIAPHHGRSMLDSVALEELTGVRVDLDMHDIDDEPPHAEAVDELRRRLLHTLSRRTALFTYRPSTLVSAVAFARRERCRYLGLFKDHQAAFEHKPWVETEVAQLGVAHIPWTYISDEEQLVTLQFLDEGPVMLRRSRSSGGVGLLRLDDGSLLAESWPQEDEAYVSVAPFIDAALPVNVSAVIWHDGITIHPASVQLIGIPSLTGRPFGYCGNDFGAVTDLEREQVEAIEAAVMRIGRWLGSHGYRGAFGVDFLVTPEGVPLFTEVNARFQGSTHASGQIAVASDESGLMLDHLAALLGLDAPSSRGLWEQAHDIARFAHFVVHWLGGTAERIDARPLVAALRAMPATRRIDIVTPNGLLTNPGATVARVTVQDRVTATGFDLASRWETVVRDAMATAVSTDLRGSPR
ncbi:MAG: ATP-grasp domain-containing protein [Solirubrobacteraceae bacterium]